MGRSLPASCVALALVAAGATACAVRTELGMAQPHQSVGAVGDLMRDQGYTTAFFGKWHLSMVGVTVPEGPADNLAGNYLGPYGFDYSTAEDWGRLRRLFRAALKLKVAGGLLAAIVLAALAPLADDIFHGHGLQTPGNTLDQPDLVLANGRFAEQRRVALAQLGDRPPRQRGDLIGQVHCTSPSGRGLCETR